MESPEGTIIFYATQAGRTADDGDGHNSPYTTAFLKHIGDKDNVATVFQAISASVYDQTKGAQVPELTLSFFGEFYLDGKPDQPASPTIGTARNRQGRSMPSGIICFASRPAISRALQK